MRFKILQVFEVVAEMKNESVLVCYIMGTHLPSSYHIRLILSFLLTIYSLCEHLYSFTHVSMSSRDMCLSLYHESVVHRKNTKEYILDP